MPLALWFAGLLGLIAAAAIASGRGRATPNDVLPCGALGIAALAYAALVAGAVWVWGGDTAVEARSERLRAGASVNITLRGVHLPLTRSIAIGHGEGATIRVPGTGPSALAHIDLDESGMASVRSAHLAPVEPPAPPEEEPPAPVATGKRGFHEVLREVIAAASARPAPRRKAEPRPNPISVAIAAVAKGSPEATATARGCKADASAALPVGGTVIAVVCESGKPVRAFGIARSPSGLVVSPYTWRGRFAPERMLVRAGDVLRLGGGDALPGVTTWDVVSLRGATSVLAVPADPTECPGWAQGGSARASASGCSIAAGAFELSSLALVPDAGAVLDRAERAAIAIGVPPLLLVLVASRRRGRRAFGAGRALRLAVIGAALTALVCWRLLWAYRIDVMRELAAIGPRVLDNELAAGAIGAALAGNAALALEALEGRSLVRRAIAAIVAWGVWLAIAWTVIGAHPGATSRTLGIVGLSLVGALVPLLGEATRRWSERLGPELALLAITAGALAGRTVLPRAPLLKLALAYATVLAGHAALRAMLHRDTTWMRRAWLAGALAATAGGLASYDAGVTLAIAGSGLALAMSVAGHDAAYDASQAGKVGVLEREHARLLAVHGAAAIALALGVATVAILVEDRDLIEHGALAVLHAPLVMVALFGLAAIVARSHRRGWAPWIAAALAALAVWGMRDALLERATAGDGVGSRRVTAVVEPGYALLRDERAFAASVSAWQEAAAPSSDVDRWTGQGYFGAHVRDPGVARSIDNDYLPVLVVREAGIVGLLRGMVLLIAIAIGAGVIASVRLRHASREHRARWLVTAVVGATAVYQPIASLGVFPLTGISWPGLGIDSPADLWLFAIGLVWCLMGGDPVELGVAKKRVPAPVADGDHSSPRRVLIPVIDERVRRTPRLARARAVALVALGVIGVASTIIVARAGQCALGRAAAEDRRIDDAIAYTASIACPWRDRAGSLDEVIPETLASAPRDLATARFDGELRLHWATDRVRLLEVMRAKAVADAPPIAPPAGGASLLAATSLGARDGEPPASGARCTGRVGHWRLARDGTTCVATFRSGWPELKLALEPRTEGFHATCEVAPSDDAITALRTPARARPHQRIRVVSAPLGAGAKDAGELVVGQRVVRLRPGTPALELDRLAPGVHAASTVQVAPDVALDLDEKSRAVTLRGSAELFVASAGGEADAMRAWQRLSYANTLALDRITLIVAGPPERRVVALYRPPRAWGGASTIDTLLADDTVRAGDARTRRAYPYGSAVPELGWVNPFDVSHSMGLDGWIHAAHAAPADTAACGTLAPPAVPREQVCSRNPLDGVTECRISLQPELAIRLRGIAEGVLADPKPHTGREITPVRAAYVVLRGDTGELLAQGNVVPGRPLLAYAPIDEAAEAALVKLRDERAENDAERVDWNLPIAVGSTFKPIVARAAEQAFPSQIGELGLKADGHGGGCKGKRSVDPLLGHCPPTPVGGQPTSADFHDFLARSPNWYMAALGIIGLGLPSGKFTVDNRAVTLADIAGTDLTSWPADKPLEISDDVGPILTAKSVHLDGVRRTKLWSRIEAFLGRPICTLGDRTQCERAAARADVCSARALPIKSPSADLRYLVALGPSQVDLYAGDRPKKGTVPVREYFQLMRGSGLHAVGSLAQITDAFGRVVYDPAPAAPRLAATWFPAPVAGTKPDWTCAATGTGHQATVRGADGGLCAVLQPGGTAHTLLGDVVTDPNIVLYGAKTGTIDSLAEIARRPAACRAWNDSHVPAAQLACGKVPPDDSLFILAFGVVTPQGTIPITLGLQLQRGGKGSATRTTPHFVKAIAKYLRG